MKLQKASERKLTSSEAGGPDKNRRRERIEQEPRESGGTRGRHEDEGSTKGGKRQEREGKESGQKRMETSRKSGEEEEEKGRQEGGGEGETQGGEENQQGQKKKRPQGA
jgi:hypothetical protein